MAGLLRRHVAESSAPFAAPWQKQLDELPVSADLDVTSVRGLAAALCVIASLYRLPAAGGHVSLTSMTTTYNVAEAKAQLSRLLDAALAGEEVIVARAGRPLVRLVPVAAPPGRELGFLPMTMSDDVFDPLDGDELAAWT